VCKAYVSDLGAAEEALKDAVELARRHRGDVDILCMGLSSLSDVAELRGDREAALRHAREAVEIGERTGSPFSRVFARIGLARAQILIGTWKDASVTAHEALTLARESRTGLDWDARIFGALADAELGAGELEGARKVAMEAVQTAERRATRIWEIFARLTLVRVLVAADGTAAAAAAGCHLALALFLIEQTAAKALAPFVCVERAHL